MKLAILIQKGGLQKPATATVATLATDEAKRAGTVATIAEVAVAKGHDPTTEAELKHLVPLVASQLGHFTQDDVDEALQVALDYPDNALPWWRAQAKRLGVH